jgi:hypothetical protein
VVESRQVWSYHNINRHAAPEALCYAVQYNPFKPYCAFAPIPSAGVSPTINWLWDECNILNGVIYQPLDSLWFCPIPEAVEVVREALQAVRGPIMKILFNVGHPERQAVKDWTLRPLTFQAHLERVVLHQIHKYQSLFVQALAVTTFEWAKEPAHCSAILLLEERRNLWQFRVGDWSMARRGTTVNLLHAVPDPKGMLNFLAQHRVPVVYEWRDKWQLNPSLRVFNPDQRRFASQYAVDRTYWCELEVAQFPDMPKVSKRALTRRDSKDS